MDTSKLLFRRALDEDISGICELLEQNFIGNLPESERKDGFLSICFSADQLKEMAENGITIVALFESRVVGFLSTQTCHYNLKIPIAKTMLETISHAIDEQKTLCCGPVCIDSSFRGQGILEQMYALLAQEKGSTYHSGITFVSERNPRSIAAHSNKLGMTLSGQFGHDGQKYKIFSCNF